MIRIALVNPEIPENTGNVGRLCVGLRAELHLIRPLGFVIDDRRIRRSGLDYWSDLALTVHDSLAGFLAATAAARHYFFSTKATRPYTQARFEKGDFLVFGSESRGLPPELLAIHGDHTLKIPMPGPVRSLNLSNSVAIAAYEFFHQVTLVSNTLHCKLPLDRVS